jgi:hypothetical protein
MLAKMIIKRERREEYVNPVKKPKQDEIFDLPILMADASMKAVWLQLSFDRIKYAINENKILTDSEDTVFAAITAWVETNKPNNIYAFELLKLVRLGQLSRGFISSVVPECKWVVDAMPNISQAILRIIANQVNDYPPAWSSKMHRFRSKQAIMYVLTGRSNQTFYKIDFKNVKASHDNALVTLAAKPHIKEFSAPLNKAFYAHGLYFKLEVGFSKDNLIIVFTPTISATPHGQQPLLGASISIIVQLTLITHITGSVVYQATTGINKRCMQHISMAEINKDELSRLTIKFDVWFV